MQRYRLALAPLVMALLWSSAVEAQGGDALAQAEAAADAGDFERATELLTAVTRDPRRLSPDIARAYTLLGVVQATLGADAAASTAFEWALALDPGMPTPPELGPTQRDMLDQLRRTRRAHPLAITVDAPADASVDDAVVLHASADGAPEGRSLRVEITTWPDDDESAAISANGAGSASVAIPAGAWPAAREIHVRVDATAESGGPALVHREESVRRRGAGGGGGGSVFEEAWFWVVVGVVVAGAVTAAVVVTQLPQGATLGRPELIP